MRNNSNRSVSKATPAAPNTIADDQAHVARNVAKMMTSLGSNSLPSREGKDVDPILELVNGYLAGSAAFNAGRYNTDEESDAAAENTYGRPMKAIEDWTGAASTFEGALAALRLAADETTNFSSPSSVSSLLSAAVGYFDAAAKQDPWVKARRLAKELAATMAQCDHGQWQAYIWPDVDRLRFGFMASPEEDQRPVSRVDRLAHELSYAMDDWHQATGSKFIAHVHAASTGRGVWFMNADLEGRRS